MTERTLVIIQSNYIPWKGYFDLLAAADEVILYDDAQYTKNDWRNRNRIKTPRGPHWLTIPIKTAGRATQRIREAEVLHHDWARIHLETIEQNYRRAPFFADNYPKLAELYRKAGEESHLSKINYLFLRFICDELAIHPKFSWSMDYELQGEPTERLVSLCHQAGARRYVSGPAARNYLRPECFEEAGIDLKFMNYAGYPEYPQLYPAFVHEVSALDLMLNTGPTAGRFLLHWGRP